MPTMCELEVQIANSGYRRFDVQDTDFPCNRNHNGDDSFSLDRSSGLGRRHRKNYDG